jgi:hypothetical protein
VEDNASNKDHDEHQEAHKNAAANKLRTVFDRSRALKLRVVRSHPIAGDLSGQGQDVYLSPAVRPIHRTAEAICVPTGFIGIFGFEYLPDQGHSFLP